MSEYASLHRMTKQKMRTKGKKHICRKVCYINGGLAVFSALLPKKIRTAQGLLFTWRKIRGGFGEAPKVKKAKAHGLMCLCASNTTTVQYVQFEGMYSTVLHSQQESMDELLRLHRMNGDGDLHTLFQFSPLSQLGEFMYYCSHGPSVMQRRRVK